MYRKMPGGYLKRRLEVAKWATLGHAASHDEDIGVRNLLRKRASVFGRVVFRIGKMRL